METEKVSIPLEKYIGEPKRRKHYFKDVTRQIIVQQVAKFLACKDCVAKPVVSFPFKVGKSGKQLVGVCGKHWEGLAETVIGWSGE